MILALSGGVGGAKLAHGLTTQLTPDELTIIVNTGDDFTHLGLHISPDLDTVMYWLRGMNDPVRGWGIADETWNFMSALKKFGAPTWFKLGDRDLATHIERTRLLADGETLSQATATLCARLGIRHRVAPMTDDPVRTIVHTSAGALEFQHYFVRLRCGPAVTRLEYRGADLATPSEALRSALANDLKAVIICPSNPFLSIGPILAVKGIRELLRVQEAPVIAISPIVGSQAIKGPAAKILSELGLEVSSLEIARNYREILDGIVIDNLDVHLKSRIEALGLSVAITNTIMRGEYDQVNLAQEVLRFAANLREVAHV